MTPSSFLLISLLLSLELFTPSNSLTSYTFFTNAFLPIDPPFTCAPSVHRLLREVLQFHETTPSIFQVTQRLPNEAVENILSPNSAFARAAQIDATTFSNRLTSRYQEQTSTNSPNPRNSPKPIEDVVEELQVVAEVSDALFSDSQEPRFFLPETLSLGGFVGSSEILICAAAKVLGSGRNPRNLGDVLCECASRTRGVIGKCRLVKQLSTTLGCAAAACSSGPYKPPYIPSLPLSDSRLDLPLTSLLPTPATISSSTVNAEIYTYFLLWKSIATISTDASLTACTNTKPALATLPGWTIEQHGFAVETKSSGGNEKLPFARVASHKNSNNPALTDFLVSIRGTITPAEWGIDFSYNQVLQGSAEYPPMHRGFLGMATSIWAPLEALLTAAEAKGELGFVTITGHSLGAGVAAVLSLLVSQNFELHISGTTAPRFRTVLFAPPKAGPSSFVTQLATQVNLRSIVSAFDPVPKIPCNSFPGCPAEDVPIPTATDYKTVFEFAEYPGSIVIPMSALPPAFAVNGSNLKVGAWHICSYDCWTSLKTDPAHASSCLAAAAKVTNSADKCPYL